MIVADFCACQAPRLGRESQSAASAAAASRSLVRAAVDGVRGRGDRDERAPEEPAHAACSPRPDHVDLRRAAVRREPEGRLVGRDQAGGLDPRPHRRPHRRRRSPATAACSRTGASSRPGSRCWSRSSPARTRSSRSGSPRSCTRTRSGWAAAARSPTRSAASTSRCGTSSARSRECRSAGCSAAPTGRRVQPYCSLLMEEPARDAGRRGRVPGRAASAPSRSAGGRSAARGDARLDEAIVRAAREAVGADAKLFVDAGASDAYWPHGLKWAMRTAEMLKDYDVGWFEEALRPDAIDDFCHLRRVSPVPIAGGEVLTRRQAFLPWLVAGRLRHRPAGRHQGRRHQRAAPHRLDGRRFRRQVRRPRLEHGLGRRRRPAARLGLARRPTSSSSSAAAPTSTASWPSPSSSTPTAIFPSPTAPGSASPSTARSSRASPPILRRCSLTGNGVRSGRIDGPGVHGSIETLRLTPRS